MLLPKGYQYKAKGLFFFPLEEQNINVGLLSMEAFSLVTKCSMLHLEIVKMPHGRFMSKLIRAAYIRSFVFP